MDSTNDSYIQYHNSNNNVDINHFLNGVQDFANFQDDTQGLDPALFDIGNGDSAPFQTQQGQSSQANHSNYNQSQRQTQSQSPALPSFKPGQNTFSSHPYAQSLYDQRSMAHPAFDSHLAARPSASPQPFDHFNINYNQQFADPRFNNFTTQRQPTPTQPFRPQVNPAHYMNMSNPSPRPQPHVSQVQNAQGMSYPYQQASQLYRTVDPSMLNAGGQAYQSVSNGGRPGQSSSSPYFQQAPSTLNPRDLQAQYNMQIQRPQGLPVNAQQPNGMISQQAQQSVLQFQPQSAAALAAKATKEQKVKAKKGAGKGSSASDSDDDLDIEDEPPEAKPAMIIILKPTDQPGRLLWEVVDAVWSPRNKPASADKIRTAVAFVGEAVRNVRDQWKAQNEQLKKAELPAASNALQVPALKAAVSMHRETMERLVGKVTQFGHPWILKRLGENHFTLAALYSFLLDRVNADDYNSTLASGILQLGSKFETLDEEVLEKVKWTKILARFVKRSTNDSKKFAQQMIDNARANTAKKSEAAGQGPASPAGSASGISVPPVAGVKRAREGSEPIQQAKKPAVKPSSKPLSLQIAEARKAKEKEKAAATAAVKGAKTEKSVAANGTSTVAARPKATPTAPPKVSQFASLMSASKRPGTSIAERAAKDKVKTVNKGETTNVFAIKKDAVAKTDAPSSRTTSSAPPATSFLGFLADMDKPKADPTPRPEEILNETPEARAERLRKESRRKLRVSWKNDNELVQTRIFEHDPDEETGHEDSMMRDAGDTTKEGEMLKHKFKVDDMDEDEDDDEIEYSPPSEVDFEVAGKEVLELNFFKFGGTRKPESPCSEAQDKHEEGNLMTTYLSRDQPDTPKEPPEDVEEDDFSPAVDFGESPKDFVRQREKQILARRQAYQPQPQQAKSNGFDLASMLANVQSQQATQNQSQNWQQSAYNQSTQSQAQPAQPNHPGLDFSKLLAVAQQMQQSQQQPQPAYQAPAALPQSSPTPAVEPNIAALLASFTQQAAVQAGNAGSYAAALPISQGASPNPWPGMNAEPQKEQQPKQKKNKGHGKGKAPLGSDGLPLNYKTQVCQYWLDGRCAYGDACTYKHEKE